MDGEIGFMLLKQSASHNINMKNKYHQALRTHRKQLWRLWRLLGILQTLIRQFLALTRTGRQTEMLISGLLLQYSFLSNRRKVSSSGQEMGLLPSLSPHQGRRQQVGRNVHLLRSAGKSTELGIKRSFLTSSFNHLQLYDLGQVP